MTCTFSTQSHHNHPSIVLIYCWKGHKRANLLIHHQTHPQPLHVALKWVLLERTSRKDKAGYTVMILSFWTDGSGQRVQTQIRLLLVWSESTLFAILYAFFWTHYSMVGQHRSNFRINTAIFRVSKYLGILQSFYFKMVTRRVWIVQG